MGERRGHFPPKLRQSLADRVGGRCSNPNCRSPTTAASRAGDASVSSIGVASHIHAASGGGPRYDPGQDETVRHSIENALWLCQTCSKLIDVNGGADYSADTLRMWKIAAETLARSELEAGQISEIAWDHDISHLRYVNVPTLLQFAARGGREVRYPGLPPDGWLHNFGWELNRTLIDCEHVLNDLDVRAIPLESLAGATEDWTGHTVAFNSRFYTKNGPSMDTHRPPPPVPSNWREATHIYTKIGNRKLVMVMDPRWITTTTAFCDFRSGQMRFAGLAILKKASSDDNPMLASPVVIGGARAQRELMDMIFPPSDGRR